MKIIAYVWKKRNRTTYRMQDLLERVGMHCKPAISHLSLRRNHSQHAPLRVHFRDFLIDPVPFLLVFRPGTRIRWTAYRSETNERKTTKATLWSDTTLSGERNEFGSNKRIESLVPMLGWSLVPVEKHPGVRPLDCLFDAIVACLSRCHVISEFFFSLFVRIWVPRIVPFFEESSGDPCLV